MLQVLTFHGHEMPLVEVRVDGVWHLGDLRAWRQAEDRSWTAQVSWSRSHGERFLTVFAAADVRAFDEEAALLERTARLETGSGQE